MDGGIYLAYPIDQRGPDAGARLSRALDVVKEAAIGERLATWVFDPGNALRVDPDAEPDPTLARINRVAADNAAAVVAFLPAGVPGIGVPVEIDRAVTQGKHVVLFPDVRASWALAYPADAVARYRSWDEDDVRDALSWLRQRG